MIPLFEIFTSFLKVGALLFGGGYAMLPLLEQEVVAKRNWCKEGEMADYYAMAQLVPGVIAVNTAMLIGYKLRKFPGTVIATLGVVAAPFTVILAYAILYDNLAHFQALEKMMCGLRPAVAGMMLGMTWKLFQRTGKSLLGIAITLATLLLIFVAGLSAVSVILTGLLAAVAWWLITLRKKRGA